jgi:hypothetical protein
MMPKSISRHCERSEAIQLCRGAQSWIASSQALLAMTTAAGNDEYND